jgi:hypothetical protein
MSDELERSGTSPRNSRVDANHERSNASQRRRIAILAPMRSELRPLKSPLGLSRSNEGAKEFFPGRGHLAPPGLSCQNA